MLKRAIVRLLGRERANRLSAPYHDWRARIRTTRTLASLPRKDLCLNLGCGSVPLAGWVNVDVARAPDVDVVWDITRGLPFLNESCSAIFAEHVIEHLSNEEGSKLISECHRVLQDDGVFRVSTPDAERYLRSYAGDGEFLRHPQFTRPADTPLDRINAMMREDGLHRWVYDAPSLLLALRRCGFTSCETTSFGASLHPRMQGIDSAEREFESLYVEAVR